MPARTGAAMVLGKETAGIGRGLRLTVRPAALSSSSARVQISGEQALPKPVAQHDVGHGAAPCFRCCTALEGMEWQSTSSTMPRACQAWSSRAPGPVIGPIDGFDAVDGVLPGQGPVINQQTVAHRARDGAEARRHAGRGAVHIAGRRFAEHAAVEFEGFAVEVEIAAREQGAQQGGPGFEAA